MRLQFGVSANERTYFHSFVPKTEVVLTAIWLPHQIMKFLVHSTHDFAFVQSPIKNIYALHWPAYFDSVFLFFFVWLLQFSVIARISTVMIITRRFYCTLQMYRLRSGYRVSSFLLLYYFFSNKLKCLEPTKLQIKRQRRKINSFLRIKWTGR